MVLNFSLKPFSPFSGNTRELEVDLAQLSTQQALKAIAPMCYGEPSSCQIVLQLWARLCNKKAHSHLIA